MTDLTDIAPPASTPMSSLTAAGIHPRSQHRTPRSRPVVRTAPAPQPRGNSSLGVTPPGDKTTSLRAAAGER
jgi:hypothetical protein